MSINLSQYVYIPAVRSSTYNLGAMRELYPYVKDSILPLIIMRGSNYNDIENFLKAWDSRPVLLDSSRYPSDVDTTICNILNESTGNFAEKLSIFLSLKKISPNLIPVIGYRFSDPTREIVQLTLTLIAHFDFVAIKVNLAENPSINISQLQSILSAVPDFSKVILLIDYGKIQSITDIKQTDINTILHILSLYNFALVATLSTSYPSVRPTPGTTLNHSLLDPVWQNQFKLKANVFGYNVVYGDYSATDPTTEALDFDFAVHPIPFATYLLDYLEWFTTREGAGGEYVRFRDIAQTIRLTSGYHGDTFCWGNDQIKEIGTGSRAKPGNQAYWNKIKINQHISAIIQAISNGVLHRIGLSTSEDESEEE